MTYKHLDEYEVILYEILKEFVAPNFHTVAADGIYWKVGESRITNIGEYHTPIVSLEFVDATIVICKDSVWECPLADPEIIEKACQKINDFGVKRVHK